MRRFKFGGFGGQRDDRGDGAASGQGQAGPSESWMPPEEQEQEHGGSAPSGDDFEWPSPTPSSTAGQPEGTAGAGDGESAASGEGESQAGDQGQAVAGWSRLGQQPAAQEGVEQPTDEHSTVSESEEAQTQEEAQTAADRGSRVSVIDEHDDQSDRPPPPPGADEEEYKWHTYVHYPSGRPDAVEFVDTYKSFGRNHILRGLNMGLPEGMVSMILGPSGTGKSVCIKHMVGLLYPDEGDVIVHGQSVPNMADDDLFEMRKKFGLLFQDGALFGSMNVFDNVAFPLRQHTEKGEDEISDIVTRRLNEVGLGAHGDKLPNELSGGMRKRAGFARALVLEPDIVLFDEPDSGLDPVRTALLGELILEIHRDMMDEAKEKQREHLPTFAVITHDIMSARRVADYINVLWKGRIVEAGPAEDMLNSDNPFIRQFLAGESQGPLTMD
jgi:phospholipid/cholesterol/gamma-HCH transport system ATP-binding protein